MELQKEFIDHYQVSRMDQSRLWEKVMINREYLKEKPTWYMIGGVLHYFKIRNDYRLFTELFCSNFGELMGLDTLKYKVAYLKDTAVYLSKVEQATKTGLLSESFQDTNYNYYLISELLKSEVSDLKGYGGYNLQSLLSFLKVHTTEECYSNNKDFLIRLFICDYFTHQLDRNPHNVSFKIPRIAGIGYKQRLRLDVVNPSLCSLYGEFDDDGFYRISDLTPTVVYDNERSLGADHKKPLSYTAGEPWLTLFPFNGDMAYSSLKQAQSIKEDYNGMDPNIVELALNYEKESIPLLERLAYDNEYQKVLEQHLTNTSQIRIKDSTCDFLTNMFEDKRKEIKKVLTIFK